MDALDNVESRLLLEQVCIKKGIPLIHGAIGNAQYQISTIINRPMLKNIFSKNQAMIVVGNPSPTVTICAALQVGEAVKVLTGMGDVLEGSFLLGNWMYADYDVVALDKNMTKTKA